MKPAFIKKKYTIGLSDVDFMKTLKISALFQYFQEMASIHGDILGFGLNKVVSEHNVTWVLAKIKIEIDRLPMWNEEIEIETWPLKPKRVEVMRDYIVRDMSGNVLIKAISAWVILDITTRELQKTDMLSFGISEFVEKRAIDQRIAKLKPFSSPELSYKKTIMYSDIDINGHLNNSKYADYIMDCFPCEIHEEHRVSSIQVNFINEALHGETIALCRDISNINTESIYVEGLKEDNECQIFSSVIELKKR